MHSAANELEFGTLLFDPSLDIPVRMVRGRVLGLQRLALRLEGTVLALPYPLKWMNSARCLKRKFEKESI